MERTPRNFQISRQYFFSEQIFNRKQSLGVPVLSELNLCETSVLCYLISFVSAPLQQTLLISVLINFVSSQLALNLSSCIPFDECVN